MWINEKFVRVTGIMLAVTVGLLSYACVVVGVVTFARCTRLALLDVWLIVHDITLATVLVSCLPASQPRRLERKAHVWLLLSAVSVWSLATRGLTVVIPLPLLVFPSSLDLSTFKGVTVLGAFFGLLIWRFTDTCGRVINGPRILLWTLLSINAIWLFLGNVAVGITYGSCSSADFGTLSYLETIECSSFLLPFTLAVVLIFDVIYIIFIMVLCFRCNNCCTKEPKTTSTSANESSWMWWTALLSVLGYLMLGVFSIGVGASFKQPCRGQEWSPIYLCVHGSIIVIKVILMTFWARLKLRIGDSWVQPTLMFAVPFVFFCLITVTSLTIGGVSLVQERIQNCNGEPVCSSTLQVCSAVIFSLISVPFLVLLYAAVVILILAMIFLALTSCHYFYDHRNAIQVVTCDDNL